MTNNDDITLCDAMDKIYDSLNRIDNEINHITLVGEYVNTIKIHGYHPSTLELLKYTTSRYAVSNKYAVESLGLNEELDIQAVTESLNERAAAVLNAIKNRMFRMKGVLSARVTKLKQSATSLVRSSKNAKNANENASVAGVAIVTAQLGAVGTIMGYTGATPLVDVTEKMERIARTGDWSKVKESSHVVIKAAKTNPYKAAKILHESGFIMPGYTSTLERKGIGKVTGWVSHKYMEACTKVAQLIEKFAIMVERHLPSAATKIDAFNTWLIKRFIKNNPEALKIPSYGQSKGVAIMVRTYGAILAICATMLAAIVATLWRVGKAVFNINKPKEA